MNENTTICLLGGVPFLFNISVNDIYLVLMIVVLMISIISSIVGLYQKFKETKTVDNNEVEILKNQVDELLNTFDKLNKDNDKKD